MLSLRSKLVIWHTVIVAIVLTAFAYAIYTYLSYGLMRIVDNSLLSLAQTIEHSMSNSSDPRDHGSAPTIAPQYVQTIEPDGRITDQYSAIEGRNLPVDIQHIKQITNGNNRAFETIEVVKGDPVRVITYTVLDEHKEVDVYIRVGQSLSELQTAQTRFLWFFSWTMPLALLLTILGGYWLAHRALAPVDRLTTAARLIGEKNLKERVETPSTNDELGRLADTFNQMISRLELAFERQRQFTADASHELRTPLAVMRNDIEIALRRERDTAEYQRVLGSVLEENVRLSKLVDDLLTLARSDSGEVEVERKPVQFDVLARELAGYIAPMAEAKGLELSVKAQPVTINGDARRLKQLVLNLLDNAIKYSDKGGEITLSLSSSGDRGIMLVSDTGRGISAEDQLRVFDRFFRHSHASGESAAGTGLGLAICKWIVQAHAGTISVSSVPGKGSEFRVELPVSPESSS